MNMPTPFADLSPLKKLSRFPWTAGAVIVLLLSAASGVYAWYSLQRSCDPDAVKQATERLVRQRNSYDHSYQFATSVSQNAVVRPVTELQQIQMYTQDVEVPACMQKAKEELIQYMGTVIRAFLAFGAQEPESVVRDLLNQSNTHYDNFNTELEAVNKCAPICFP